MSLKFHGNFAEFEYNAMKINQCYAIIKADIIFCTEQIVSHLLFMWSNR